MKKILGGIIVLFLLSTNLTFGYGQDCVGLDFNGTFTCYYYLKHINLSEKKLISSGQGGLTNKLETYVSNISQKNLIKLKNQLSLVKQTEKNKELLNFLTLLVYDKSAKFKKEEGKYSYNGFGEKIGYSSNVTFKPKTYSELADILNEKGIIDKSNYVYRPDGSVPRPYKYPSAYADGRYSLDFYKYIETHNNTSLPLYLIPNISYNAGEGEAEVKRVKGFELDIKSLPAIDIAKYPSIKTLVDKAMEFDKLDRDMFRFTSSAATQYVKDNNFNEKLAQEVYQLLIDNGINKEDYTLSGNVITYNGGGGLFSTSVTADSLAMKLYENSKDWNNGKESGTMKNSFDYYKPGRGVNLLIDLYLNKLGGYKMSSENLW